ncbi:beta-1,3-galactosyltransferase 6-like [Lycorma delicatula]|uniref:beta-1,3-galactosyltransferase 6-like n=1 Tax=Lycorma delicatula TaxID=130591 RepID=UPI003F516A7F
MNEEMPLKKCDVVRELKTNFLDKNLLYWGFFDGRAPVKRVGKWKEENWFLCDRYLPYALGGGYVLSHALVKYISRNAELLSVYNSEDVSVGVWLSPLNITRIHDPRFDTEFSSRGCSNAYLITHKQSEKLIRHLYSETVTHGRMCTKETQTRLSYIYNWNVPPSQCCVRNDSSVH